MPFPYVLSHIVATLLCFCVVLRVPKRPGILNAAGILALLLVITGFVVERRTDWAWTIMSACGIGLVFITNVSLEGVAVLSALMWRTASTRRQKQRAFLFCLPLFCLSLWTYAWYFEPMPSGINGGVDRSGFCRQTTDDTCSAAAAVMLLYHQGIPATESEMARLCLTRAGQGTSSLGLFYGLAMKAAPQKLRPRLMHFNRTEQLRRLNQPAIISVGLAANTAPAVAAKMQEYGWSVGSWHSVVVLGADSTGKWIEVADPTNGKERWPADDLKYLWDGNALILTAR